MAQRLANQERTSEATSTLPRFLGKGGILGAFWAWQESHGIRNMSRSRCQRPLVSDSSIRSLAPSESPSDTTPHPEALPGAVEGLPMPEWRIELRPPGHKSTALREPKRALDRLASGEEASRTPNPTSAKVQGCSNLNLREDGP